MYSNFFVLLTFFFFCPKLLAKFQTKNSWSCSYWFVQNNSFHRWNPKPKFTDPTVRKHWDPSKSPAINLANLGLIAKPNQDVHRSYDAIVDNDHENGEKKVDVVELFDIPDSDELRAAKQAKRLPVSVEDQQYMVKCMSKYGTDYKKMFQNVKINYMQHTEQQLRKLGARFLLLTPDQCKVPIPPNVQELFSTQPKQLSEKTSTTSS